MLELNHLNHFFFFFHTFLFQASRVFPQTSSAPQKILLAPVMSSFRAGRRGCSQNFVVRGFSSTTSSPNVPSSSTPRPQGSAGHREEAENPDGERGQLLRALPGDPNL